MFNLVVGCVLGVVHLEVRLIACLLPWSSGKSERRKCKVETPIQDNDLILTPIIAPQSG
jgi:hypothetical protein